MRRQATGTSESEILSPGINYFTIGKQVRAYRKRQNLTQKNLAEKVGISVQHLSHIECGSTKLSLPALVSLAEVLSVDVNILLSRNSTLSRIILNNELTAILSNAAPDDLELCTSACQAILTTRNRQRGIPHEL